MSGGQAMLLAFEADDDSRRAFDVLGSTLAQRGIAIDARVGYQGGYVDTEVNWHQSIRMWSLLGVNSGEKQQFWCAFGVEDPAQTQSLDIAVEINPRYEGTDLVVGGAFAKDERGAVHFCHNGKIGGGREGVGKSAFFRHYSDPGGLEQMLYNDRLVNVVDLGPITSPRLPRRLARFAHEVVRIKEVCAKEQETGTAVRGLTRPAIPTFSPEFSGRRAAFSVSRRIDAKADHGLVVDALEAAVRRGGQPAYNDGARDLFVLDEHGRMSALFEVKTDVTTTSIYTAVGQLLLNGGADPRPPRMVLVLPDKPNKTTSRTLKAIGVAVLDFKWRGNTPVIDDSALKRVMR